MNKSKKELVAEIEEKDARIAALAERVATLTGENQLLQSKVADKSAELEIIALGMKEEESAADYESYPDGATICHYGGEEMNAVSIFQPFFSKKFPFFSFFFSSIAQNISTQF